jgi:hypothetical protein
MPQMRFPKRDTEGLSSALVDNDKRTYVTLPAGSTLSVNYVTPKFVYAIIVVPFSDTHIIDIRAATLQITDDGVSYTTLLNYITNTNMSYAYSGPYWMVNKSVKGWRLKNNSASSDWFIGEIIVLTPDDTKPYLEVLYPDTIEIIDDGTTNLDSFNNLSYISDGNDYSAANFIFRGGYSTYTLYLKGEFSLPMISAISPFVLIDINPNYSNLVSVMDIEKSHGYFHWGTKDSIPIYGTNYLPYNNTLYSISNLPQERWSQKVYEVVSGSSVSGSFNDNLLNPNQYTHLSQSVFGNRSALLEALPVFSIVDQKRLYAPYFFSFRHRPIFINSGYHIYYATDNITEPFIYVAANGSTNKIYLKFGLRIETISPVTSSFTVRIYGMGFLCFPQMDLEIPISIPNYAVWHEFTPLGGVTRDNNESTESPDITTDEKLVSIYPVAVDVSSGRAIRYRIRSTSGGTSTFNVDRYYGFHRASDDRIFWYYKRDSYSVGNTLQSFDVTGEDQMGQTKVIKVEIKPT